MNRVVGSRVLMAAIALASCATAREEPVIEVPQRMERQPVAMPPPPAPDLCSPVPSVECKTGCQVDEKCPTRMGFAADCGTVFAGEPDEVEARLVRTARRDLEWLFSVLNLAVPAPTFKASCLNSKLDDDGWLFQNVRITGTDGKFLPQAGPKAREELVRVLTSLKTHSVPASVPVKAATVCLDITPLVREFDESCCCELQVRVPRKALESVKFPDLDHTRRGFVTAEDGTGTAVAQEPFPWPGLVTIANKQSLDDRCDVRVKVESRREYKDHEVPLRFSPSQAKKANRIELRMAGPGEAIGRHVELIPRPEARSNASVSSGNTLLLDVAPYASLLRAAYATRVEVSERMAENDTLLVAWGATPASKDRAKDLRQAATRLSTRPPEDSVTGDVCLLDNDGAEIARFSPGQAQLGQFESYLNGIDKIRTVVYLDVKKAGLGPVGIVEVVLPEEDIGRLYKLVNTTPNATFVAKHENKSEIERTAFVALPVENDGHLRVKVQMSQALAVKPTDKLLIKGPGFDLYGLLIAFPDVDKLLEALVTSYGVMKEVRFPASAFSVVREPVKVVFGPGRYYVSLVAEDAEGRVVAMKDDKLNIGLIAEKPLSGRCAVVLRPDPGVLTTHTKFDKSDAREIKKVRNVRLVDRDVHDVQVKFDMPAPCGPVK